MNLRGGTVYNWGYKVLKPRLLKVRIINHFLKTQHFFLPLPNLTVILVSGALLLKSPQDSNPVEMPALPQIFPSYISHVCTMKVCIS